LLLTFACARPGEDGAGTGEEIVLGCHSDLSGPAAPFGVAGVNAMRVVFDRANARAGVHGRQIRFVVEDAQYQVPRAVQAANKLINRDRIFAMVGAMGTPMNNAVMRRQLEAGVPNLFPFSAARSMHEPLHPMKFAALTPYYSQVRAGVEYFVEERGKERICTMTQDTDFGQEVTDAVDDQLGPKGMEVVAATAHRPTDTDFSAALVKLEEADCDLVVLGTIVRDTILAVSGARAMDWEVDFLGPISTFEYVVAEAEGGVTEGYYAMTTFEAPYSDHPRDEVREWIAAYEERFDERPNSGAVLGWVAAELTVRALRDAGPDLTTESFLHALEGIDDYQDIFGGPVLSFGPDKHLGTEESFLARIEGGRWVRVTGNLSY
jgi:branched-chain amino acid transport system substrate-binding protein